MMQAKNTHARVLFLLLSTILLWWAIDSMLKGKDRFTHTHVNCAIQARAKGDTTKGLLTGYNYFLLEKFAQDNDITLDIRFIDGSDQVIDSLKSGSLDILSVPISDIPAVDSIQTSIPVDSISVWLVSLQEQALLTRLNNWLSEYHMSAGYDSTRALFMTPPSNTHISPYDGLFKAYADTLGWDWHILAAMAYQESRFRIEAKSPRGAQGLMQMMPSTARHYDVKDLLDPKESIRACCKYLKVLGRRYRRMEKKEQIKFTLAAYNAGERRIKDALSYARHLNVNTECWDSVARVIPDLGKEEIYTNDTLNVSMFSGVETISYVDKVISLYERFKLLCPAD